MLFTNEGWELGDFGDWVHSALLGSVRPAGTYYGIPFTPRTGNYSLWFSTPSATSQSGRVRWTITDAAVLALLAGKTVTFKGWCWAQLIYVGGGDGGNIRQIEVGDDSDSTTQALPMTPYQSWQQVEVSHTIGADPTEVFFEIDYRKGGNRSMYLVAIDDMESDPVSAIVLPTVTTNPATSVAASSAVLNGILNQDGGEACACGFEWGETIAYGNTTPTQSKETGESFLQAISGLSPGITHHFRAFATNSQGTSHGSDRTFSTSIVAPSVTTNPATEVSILNGTLVDDGGEACDCGFEWGETIAYGNVTATQSKETGETFAHLLGELSPATTYHFRALATNSKGTSYGSDQSFTTSAGLPILTTEAASAIGLNGATLNGALTSDGGEPCYCGFEWGATIAYGTTTPTQRKVTGEVFSQTILHLGEAAQYHFRAFATNSSGTAYGEDRTLDTLFRINKAYALARYEV